MTMTKNIAGQRLLYAALIVASLLAGCAGPVQRAEQHVAQDEWLKAVIEYRKAHTRDPQDVEYKSRLKQMELKAADYYYQRGMAALERENIDGAILQFQQGLAAMSDHAKLQQAMGTALARKEANNLYSEGSRAEDAGKTAEAMRLFKAALEAYPDHKPATQALAKLRKQEQQDEDSQELALSSRTPITLNFRQTDLRTAFEFIAKSFGINVIFDDGIRSVPVTLFAKDVTFEQALNLLLTTNKTFYKKIGPNTLIIIPDTKEKRGQYEDHLVRTFQLNTVKAKEMNDILKGLLTLKKVFVNDELNTLVVRDTDETLKLVEKMIQLNDRKPAEIILEVEILEVNRSKSEQLGLEFGNPMATIKLPGDIPLANSISKALQSGSTLTLSGATFRYYKQDVDAKTLANPKVRVINGKSAKIHVGDRVPLRASTIVDSTSQVRTTYDYKEIGIKLTVEPSIHLDNSVTVKLGLEVSALGANLGTSDEPAYSIGTRNAETFMLLRDGETAILGGLIRDEDRAARVRVPLLGDIPALGTLFRSYDNSKNRTDVLLTITPRVVRSWDVAPKDMQRFYSGTADTYTDQALFGSLQAPVGAKPVVQTNGNTNTSGSASAAGPVPVVAAAAGAASAEPATNAGANTTPVATAAAPPIFAFSAPVYEGTAEQELEIRLVAENLPATTAVPVEVLFNPQLLKFVRGQALDFSPKDFKTEVDEAKGMFRVALAFPPDAPPKGNGGLARVVFKAVKPGISYLVYKVPALTDNAGGAVNAQVRASRIVIK